MTSNLLQSRDVAEFLRVSELTVKKWRHEGKGPPFRKIGRIVRYEESEVIDWLRNHCDQDGKRAA